MTPYIRRIPLLYLLFLSPLLGVDQTQFHRDVYVRVGNVHSNQMDDIVNENRQQFQNSGGGIFQKKEALFKLSNPTRENNTILYKIESIEFEDRQGLPELHADFLADIRVRYDGGQFTFAQCRLSSSQARVSHQYAMFWHGKPFYTTEELQAIERNPSGFLETQAIEKWNQKDSWSDDQKSTFEKIGSFDLFTLGFYDLAAYHQIQDVFFPLPTKIAFPRIQRVFQEKNQAIRALDAVWEEYPTPTHLFQRLCSKAHDIDRAVDENNRVGLMWAHFFSHKYEVLRFALILYVASVTIKKVGNFLWDRSLKYLFPISYLPTAVRDYTRDKNILITFADTYLPDWMSHSIRQFLQKRGWWRPLPPLRTIHVIFPDDLTEKYIKDLLQNIEYIILANRTLIAAGKKPIYGLPIIIFYGHPGRGKTLFFRMIVSELRAKGLIHSCEVNIPELSKLTVSEASLFWEEIQSNESAYKPLVLLVNEGDDALSNRYTSHANPVKKTITNGFLSAFDRKQNPYRCCFITMNTMLNDPQQRKNMDSAVLSRAHEFQIKGYSKENLIRILLLHLQHQGKEVNIKLTDTLFLKQELANHPIFDLPLEPRDFDAIANKIIRAKDQKLIQSHASSKRPTKNTYLVIHDILAILDEEMQIHIHNHPPL